MTQQGTHLYLLNFAIIIQGKSFLLTQICKASVCVSKAMDHEFFFFCANKGIHADIS